MKAWEREERIYGPRTLEQRVSDVKWLAVGDIAQLLDVPYSAVYMQTTEPHNLGDYDVSPLLVVVMRSLA